MDKKMREVLKKIAEALNDEGVSYGIGASVMLYHHGIGRSPRDIDIQVELSDIKKLDEILSAFGEKRERLPNAVYRTRYFYEYDIDGVEVDVMGGLCVNHEGEDHAFDFTGKSLEGYMDLEGIRVPLVSLREWHEIYKVLPGREEKVEMIEKYMREKGKLQ